MEQKSFYYEQFLKAQIEQSSQIEFVTPDIARHLLSNNDGNRPISKRIVKQYAGVMRKGQWHMNGENIIISKSNRLLNGQHRLTALIDCGISIPFWVTRGVDDSSFTTMDCNKPRTIGDVFSISDIPNYNNIAAMVSGTITLMSNYSLSSKNAIVKDKCLTKQDFLNEYNESPELYQKAYSEATKLYLLKYGLFTTSEMGAMIMFLVKYKKYDFDYVLDFFKMAHVEIPSTNSTIRLLKNILAKNKESKKKMTAIHKFMLTAKTWNCYVSNRMLKQLHYDKEKEGQITFI